MENDEEPQKIDISKIFIKTLKNIYLSYYRQSNLDEIVKSVEELDIDKFVEKSYEFVATGANNISDTFVDSWIKKIQDKLEEEKSKITYELKKTLTEDEINERLKKIPNIGDLRKEDFINYQKFIQENLIDKLGLKNEVAIENFLKDYVDNVIKTSITDATASLPLTLAQFLASIFPLGSELLVSVDTLNNIVNGITNNMASGLVKAGLVKTDVKKIGGRGRRRKRKSKSKHFYINRIKRTLKYFYNY